MLLLMDKTRRKEEGAIVGQASNSVFLSALGAAAAGPFRLVTNQHSTTLKIMMH